MLNKVYSAAFICLVIAVVFWIFASGILERFRTIEADCAVAGLGNVSIKHQYTNSRQSSLLAVNDQNPVVITVKNTDPIVNLEGPALQGKLNIETTSLFITLDNKSYSGTCAINQFSM